MLKLYKMPKEEMEGMKNEMGESNKTYWQDPSKRSDGFISPTAASNKKRGKLYLGQSEQNSSQKREEDGHSIVEVVLAGAKLHGGWSATLRWGIAMLG